MTVLCTAPAIAYELTELVKLATCLSIWGLLLNDIVPVLSEHEPILEALMKGYTVRCFYNALVKA